MGDINQLLYLKRQVQKVDGAVLEVGSKNYGSTQAFRYLFPGNEYVGADSDSGEGVDVVHDFTQAALRREGGFALVICCSVLEHVERPWLAAHHIAASIRPGGLLYIAVPWVWRYHAYPDDYWRFSWSGVKQLFPGFEWSEPQFSTLVPAEFLPAKPGADSALASVVEGRKLLPYLQLHMLGRKESLLSDAEWSPAEIAAMQERLR